MPPASRDLFVLSLDGMEQSAVDRADPTYLAFDYMRRIANLIDAVAPGPVRVLHVGGAAMNLPRYVAATRARSSQIVLEPDLQVITQVRAEAPLPARSGIKVRPVDGAAGIREVRDGSQDLVILDAFAGAVVPDDLVSQHFVADARRVLAVDGVFVANLVDRTPFGRVRAFVAHLREAGLSEIAIGAEPATLKGKRPGNLVVACGQLPRKPFGESSPMDYRIFVGRAVSDSFGGG